MWFSKEILKNIEAEIINLSDIEDNEGLYVHIHREGLKRGIRTIADLRRRILKDREYQKLWINYCNSWIINNS